MLSGKNVEILKVSLEYFLASAGTANFFGTVASTSVEIDPWKLLVIYVAVGIPFSVYGGYLTNKKIKLEAEEKKIRAIKIENLSKQEQTKIDQLKQITQILVPGHVDGLISSIQNLNSPPARKSAHANKHRTKKHRSAFNIQISSGVGSTPVALTIADHKSGGNVNVTMTPTQRHRPSTPSTPSTQLITTQLLAAPITPSIAALPGPIIAGTPGSTPETQLTKLDPLKIAEIMANEGDDENLGYKMRM